jgi:hypothetical protein
MCTLSWRASPEGGYEAVFNRDELLTRSPEIAPTVSNGETGQRVIAPRDGNHGGTWLAVNGHGLLVGLLNDYPRGRVERGTASRGVLPLACAVARTATEAASVLRAQALGQFAPFHVVALEASGRGVHLRWDGATLHETVAPEFLTSSSFEPEAVRARRTEAYVECAPADAEMRWAFHWTHDVRDGAGSVLMRRMDASTRSVCRVRVNAERAELEYCAIEWAMDEVRIGERVSCALTLMP